MMRRVNAALAILLSLQLGVGLSAQSPTLPDGGTVRAGTAQISTSGSTTSINQASDRAIIDWRSFAIGAGGQVIFLQPTAQSATLNRVTGEQASVILGRLDANGQVLIVNPNGVIFGGGAQINVGSLVASTSNLSNANFMAGTLIFDAPGRPGAGILNAGALTAAQGGLIALVAPHVRNDGVIVARLGTVLLGAADTFTIDLYGDGLVNLALSDLHAGQLRSLNGEPVTSLITQTGTIDSSGGRIVLMTARNAKNVLDNLINMSGVVKADTAVAQGGRILLLGEGGKVDVSGSLSARGATGGSVDVLGGQIHLASTASADAGGASGGGVVHVGGAFQGSGDTLRSSQTTVDAGATLSASASGRGNGGEVVVWSDGNTMFGGAVEAKGGASAGNGGRMEVSGKGTLTFLGTADASASAGQAGTLLLDPATLDVDIAGAGVISRVLRTGTSTTLAADVDINVNAPISGGNRAAGGALTMTAGNNINVNDFVVTNNGAITMTASQGTVTVASGKAVFAGDAPITVTANGTVHTGALVTGGALAITSRAGSVDVDSFIDGQTGPVSLTAAANVDINQPIANIANGTGLNVTAGSDINVNAPVDGRGGVAGGAVTMTAAQNLNVNQSIVTHNGAVTLTAANGALNVAAGQAVVAGTGAATLVAKGDLTSGAFNAGALTMTSTGGSVLVNGLIDSATGTTRIAAASDVSINQSILNAETGSALTVDAGRDVTVNAQLDGRGGVAGGSMSLTAGRNLTLNQSLATHNGAITLTASGGSATVASGKGVFSGSGADTVKSAGDLTLGFVSGGSLSATSTGGSVNVNGVIDGSTGPVALSAAQDVQINQFVLSPRSGSAFTASAGRNIAVNAAIDGRGGASGGGVTLNASGSVAVNDSIATSGGAINITANGGSANVASGKALVSGSGAIAISAGGDVTTGGISGGSLTARSSGGSIHVNGVIDSTTGRVNLDARGNVNVNQAVLNITSGSPFVASAGNDINVNAPIDGSASLHGGSATLTAGNTVTVNVPITTGNGAIGMTATSGNATVAPGAGLYAGTGAVSVNALGDVTTGVIIGGPINVLSNAGSVNVTGAVTGTGGAMKITAANDVNVANAIANPGTSSPLTISAGTNINLNAPIDGRTSSGGQSSSVTLVAGQNVAFNRSITTQDAAISVTATGGAVTSAAAAGLFAGSGAIRVDSSATLNTGLTATTGALTFASRGGSVNVNNAIGSDTGPVSISAAVDVNVNATIANKRADAPLALSAGNDINVNAAINGLDPNNVATSSGADALTAGRNVNLNQSIATNNGAIGVTATGGSINVAAGNGLFAGTAAMTLQSAGDLTMGTITAGSLTATSTGGTLAVNNVITGSTGKVTLSAGKDVQINQAILSPSSGQPLTVTAGHDVLVNAQIDGRNGVAGGTVTLQAANNVAVNNAVITNNAAINMTATGGAINIAPAAAVSSGTGAITMTAAGDVTTGGISGGSLTARSTGGSVNINGTLDSTTGSVTLNAGQNVNVNQAVRVLPSGGAFTATAGNDINVNAQVDGSLAAVGGAATLTATRNVNVNAAIKTANAAINLTSTGGNVAVAGAAGLYAGTGAITESAPGTITTGILNGGAINVNSTGASVTVNGPVAGTGGAITIGAATNVDIASAIANTGITSPLTITAGTDINVNGQIDGRTALVAPSSTVTLTAAQNVNLNKSINTTDAAINVTATSGTVATASGGLFAGAGPITVTSGATLNTGTVDTTGALTFKSTGGSVNVNTAISGDTGTETIQAATDVNVNAGISNKRTGSTLAVTAGHDINVNAKIDGRDAVLPGSSGAVGLTAANSIGVNQNIVTRNSPITLTATNGTITAAGGGVGLFAGNATISETAGQTLNTGITSTTGAVNLTSTGSSVNINTAIPDTTGAVTITAATDVNVNQTITNLKSGANLSVTAGHDVNVAAEVDGRSGAAAGATVTMTAANNLNLTSDIATNNGAVTLTATNGSITLPVGTESLGTPMQWVVSAGSAPVSLTSGSNFTLASPIDTTGTLHVTSTSGNVTIAAPITDNTGAVTLTAGNGLIVNHQVKSADQNIVLNAGAGGITVNTITDFDQTFTSPVNSGGGNLTLNSVGNVSILDNRGIASEATLTIDTRGQILSGRVGNASTTGIPRPQSVILNADAGIASFGTGFANSVAATSSGGPITMSVAGPDKLRITTGTVGTLDCPTCDINLSSTADAVPFIGPDVVLNAGGSVNLSSVFGGSLTITARSRDITFANTNMDTITATAGRDIVVGTDTSTTSRLWASGPITLTAGRNVVANSPIHLSTTGSNSLTLTAGQNVTMNLLESLGAVNITATNGNVTLNNDIGPHYNNFTPGQPAFDPSDLGVASLSISAPSGAINMQGARAEQNVVISTGGALTAAKNITSVHGSVSITTGVAFAQPGVAIGTQDQLDIPGAVSPVIAPGPKQPLPGGPGGVGNGASGAPGLVDIAVAPADSIVAGVISPGGAGGGLGLPGTPGGGAGTPGAVAGTSATAGALSASAGAPGSAGGDVRVTGVSGGAGAPGVSGGFTAVGGSPAAPQVASASGSAGSEGADSAAALRNADQGCGKEGQQSGGGGLDAVEPGKSSPSTGGKNPSCNAAPADASAPAVNAPAPAPPPPPAAAGAPPEAVGAMMLAFMFGATR